MYKRNKKIACALLLMMVINNTSSSVFARPLNKDYQSIVMQSVDDVKIVSDSNITVDEAKKWASKRNATPTFVSLADLFWKYAPSHGGVNPAVAYVQAALETGYGRYGGVLDETYHNTCGLKRTDAGTSTDDSDKEAHKRFDNWDHGVQAHLDHLALYAGAEGYPKTNIEQNYLGDKIGKDSTYDPRHFSYLLGKANTVKDLSNNWAGAGYGDKLIDLYNSLLSESQLDDNESTNKPSDEKKQGWYQDSKNNWYYYDTNGEAHKGWLQLPDGKYYMNEKGIMVTGWFQENGSWYYFESSGRAIVNRSEVIDGIEYEFNSEGVSKAKAGWQKDSQNYWHYFDANGEAHKGWLQLPDGKYYMNEKGIMVTGWFQENGSWYYFESSGRAIVNRSEIIDGIEYEFNSEGVSKARAGWQKDNQNYWHYYDTNGEAHKGWLQLPEGKYYMNEKGIMVTGWLQNEGKWYYLESSGRAIVNRNEVIDGIEYEFNSEGVSKARAGWQKDNQNNWHYFDENGEAHKGWLQLPDGKYYMNEKGIMVTGWLQKEGKWYYLESSGRAIVNRSEVIDGIEYEFNSEGVSKARAGWQKDNQNNWHYFDENGEAHKGWLQLPDGKYYMNEKGIMVTGWLQKEGKWYYFESSGRAIVNRNEVIDGIEYEFNSEGVGTSKPGWQKDNQNNWHYFDSNGAAHTGWLQLPDGKYYMNEKGIMVTGWLQENGNWYYFENSGRAIVNRNEVIDGIEYEFNSEGVGKARPGWQKDNQNNWHYYDSNGSAHIGWLELPDGKYYMNENGIMITGWLQENGSWYYFDNSGRQSHGFIELEGLRYYLDEEGKAQTGWKTIDGKEYYFYDDCHAAQFEFVNGKYIGHEGYVKDKITVVIDPGHNNGGDSGARYTLNGVVYDETQMNMDVSVKLRDALIGQGYNVVMTRQPGEILRDNVSESLLKRVSLANREKADLFISIHHDSFNETSSGMTVFYDTYRPNVETNGVFDDSDGNSYDTTPCRAASISKDFAENLSNTLPASLGLYNRGAKYRNFYVTRNTTMPSMLIECGFISNPNEAKKISDPLHQLKMAGELTTSINKLYRR